MRSAIKRLGTAIALRVPRFMLPVLFGQFCPIFMLHRIGEVDGVHGQSVEHVERCLALLRHGRFHPLSLEQLGALLRNADPIPPRSVVFTIDDGFRDHAEVAGPLFAKYDVPLTCFVVTGFLDGHLWPWPEQVTHIIEETRRSEFTIALPDGSNHSVSLTTGNRRKDEAFALRERIKQLPQDNIYDWLDGLYRAAEVDRPDRAPPGYQPMTWQAARHFAESGHTIAPHTYSHRILSRVSDVVSRAEIQKSVTRVREVMNTSPTVFAYPNGALNDFTARDSGFAATAGISCAVTTEPRTMVVTDKLYELPRFSLPDTVEDFLQYLTFVELLKERLRR